AAVRRVLPGRWVGQPGQGARDRARDRAGAGRGARRAHLGREPGRRRGALHDHAAGRRRGAGAASRLVTDGARILVVDDEPAILRMVRTNLQRHDFRVEAAETGREALATYDRFHPDLVLLDLGLPDLDGAEVIRAIRERSSTPIVVL